MANRVPAVDNSSYQLPPTVRSRIADNLLDIANVEAVAVADLTGANVRQYGAIGDGSDESAEINAAHAANPVVVYPKGEYSPGADNNLYSSVTYTNALGEREMAGLTATPTSDARPIRWIQKHSSANRTTNPSEWDQGAFYGALIKESGDAYGAGVSAYARHKAGTGQLIGIHGRARGDHANAEVWGGWSYVYSSDTVTPSKSIVGHEINVVNRAPDQGWMGGTLANGNSRGLVVVTADASLPIGIGIDVGNNSAAPAGFIHTGLRLRASIVPSATNTGTEVQNNEYVLLSGAATTTDGATGIRFHTGGFKTGISFAEASIANNAAILFADGHRIVVGPGPAASRYLQFNVTGASANFNNMVLQVNGTQVVSTRKTGWAAATGTATRSTFATSTVTLPLLAERVKALIDDLISHGLIGA